ncbi:DNA-binding response regulator [Amnimonas aquatica]|uniref:DNA-binding response regulator n=1 Tax=Amnimonas aquatica TaxID=2094561 RepID=A0A2P6ARL6_9GAMM|nr:DNA-binding response regulator [Amnimonas aquatica]
MRVAIVDDHNLIRLSLSRMLADVPGLEIAGTAGSGEEALQLVREQQPHVLLMDLMMPGMGGHEASLRLMKQWPALRIVMLSVTEDGPLPGRLLQAGVAGYLTKGASLDELVLAIRRAACGQRYVSPELAQVLALQQPQAETAGNPFDCLSERELQVLMLLVKEKRVQDIAEQLYLSPKTVSTYRSRLLQKLGVDNDIALARLALQHGVLV